VAPAFGAGAAGGVRESTAARRIVVVLRTNLVGSHPFGRPAILTTRVASSTQEIYLWH